MAKIKLTKSAVDAAQAQAQPVELRDTLVPGFLCKIIPAGRKVFILQYRANAEDRKAIAGALKAVYDAVDGKAAEAALTAFETGPRGEKYAAIDKAWRSAWQEITPFFAFPRDVCHILYTANAIEALNTKLRRAVRARGHFPNDEAALKLLFLVLNRAEKDWKMRSREWTAARAQMAIIFGERFTKAMNA